jgi:C4-type Zn-finger protein
MVAQVAICDKCGFRHLEDEPMDASNPQYISRKRIDTSGITADLCSDCWAAEREALKATVFGAQLAFVSTSPFKDVP